MERIKQALERARQERKKAGGESKPAPSPRIGDMAESITYTETRTANIWHNSLKEKHIVSGMEDNDFTNAYKMLRTQVLQRMREQGWNALAVTSAGINEGKTLTAINLGISLAMEVDHTVLLVDADMRHPSVHTMFGLGTEYGLSDYLTDDVPLSEILVHPEGIPRFVILPGGRPLINSSEMLGSPKMSRLVEELKTRYPSRIVLFDLPPMLSAADALAFAPYVDAALLVIEEGKSSAQDIKYAIDLLQNTQLIGTVLNKSLTKNQGGYYPLSGANISG